MTTAWEIALGLLTVFSTSYGSLAFKEWLDDRKAKKNRDNNNMDVDYERRKKVEPILENIRHELNAERVIECSFSNGDTTFGGYHMKKVTATLEVYKAGLTDVASDFQLIPAANFKRTLDLLHYSEEEYAVSNEKNYNDDTSVLNMSYGFNTLVLIKIRDKYNKWVGYICVTFLDPDRTFSRAELVFAKAQTSRILT